MRRDSGKSIARQAVAALLALAVFLLPALAPAAGGAFSGSVVRADCGGNVSDPGAPGERHHHGGLCCILSCGSCGVAFDAAVFNPTGVLPRQAASPEWDLADAAALALPRSFQFAARGPPARL